jgi:hypothetical protein
MEQQARAQRPSEDASKRTRRLARADRAHVLRVQNLLARDLSRRVDRLRLERGASA